MKKRSKRDTDGHCCRVLNSKDGRHWVAEGQGYTTWPHETEAAALAALADLLQCSPSELRVAPKSIRGAI